MPETNADNPVVLLEQGAESARGKVEAVSQSDEYDD